MIVELDVEKRAPITVKYEIPYFTVSGIQVRYLKIVEKSGYQALPWVRYITQNGDDYRYAIVFWLFLFCC
jgi:AP-1 complex subunit mu